MRSDNFKKSAKDTICQQRISNCAKERGLELNLMQLESFLADRMCWNYKEHLKCLQELRCEDDILFNESIYTAKICSHSKIPNLHSF